MNTRRIATALVLGTALCSAALTITTAARAQGSQVSYHIAAQQLGPALKQFAAASGTQILFSEADVAGKRAPALDGRFDRDAALARLLAGSGLKFAEAGSNTIVVQPAPPANASPARATPDGAAESGTPTANPTQTAAAETIQTPAASRSDEKSEATAEIVVTGTHIAGAAPVGAELSVYNRQTIQESGAATIDEFARTMPANFSNNDTIASFNSTLGSLAPFSGTGHNILDNAAFNLYGLGASSTLTLLNGHRLAPAASDGSLVDISMVPLSAIDRIEVLGGGSSAIYGADAVAGVVNIITRRDFNGAESNVRFGAATDGGAEEVKVSQLLGKSWGTGNVLLTYEYNDQGGLNASDRSYIPPLSGPYSLLPKGHRNSVLLTGRQEIDDKTSITADLFYSAKYNSYASTFAPPSSVIYGYRGDENQPGVALSLERSLPAKWNLSITGNYSKVREDWSQTNVTTGKLFEVDDTDSLLMEGGILANGPLLSLPGGLLSAALGGTYRKERYGDTYTPSGRRHVSSAYGEIVAPLVSASNAMPGVQKADFSAAVRYDDYSDAGSATDYKFGADWAPINWVTFKGTVGTSFRAPLLSQLHGVADAYASTFPDSTSSTGTTDTIFELGGNPNLKPETSRSFTVGADIESPAQSTFRLSVNYFNIDFNDRIETPPLVGINFFTPALAPFVTRNPSLSLVQSIFNGPGFLGDFAGRGPTGVGAIFSDVLANIASTKESGLNLNASFRADTGWGQLTPSIDLTHLFRNEFQSTSAAPAFALLNIYGEPAAWKIRGGLKWANGPLTASVFVNYVNQYQNTLVTPSQPISAWATGDVYIGYRFENATASSWLRNVTLSLNVNNVTDARPPFVAIPPSYAQLNFDAANASPVGRLIIFQLTKALSF